MGVLFRHPPVNLRMQKLPPCLPWIRGRFWRAGVFKPTLRSVSVAVVTPITLHSNEAADAGEQPPLSEFAGGGTLTRFNVSGLLSTRGSDGSAEWGWGRYRVPAPGQGRESLADTPSASSTRPGMSPLASSLEGRQSALVSLAS